MTALLEERVINLTHRDDGRIDCRVCGGENLVVLSGELANLAKESQCIYIMLEQTDRATLRRALSEEVVNDYGVIQLDEYESANEIFFLPIFYALYEFLSTENRIETYQAHLALLLAAWQWFNLCKHLLHGLTDEQKWDKHRLEQQFPRAYQALHWLLRDLRLTRAMRLMVKNRMAVAEHDAVSNPRMREMLLLSTVLISQSWEEQSIGMGEAFAPFQKKGDLSPDWRQMKLYPMFASNEGARAEVRRLIAETLLPRYNMIDALHLAQLLKDNTQKQILCDLTIRTTPWIAIAAFIMVSSGINGNSYDSNSLAFFASIIAQIAFGLALPVVFLGSYFDWRSLPNFALPRVIGGVSIGFLTIALQGDSAISVANALWSQGGWLVGMLWLGVLAFGFGYLFLDARPFTGDDATALLRASTALIATGAIATISGQLYCAITTAAYPEKWIDTGMMMKFVLGPFGWISVGQWLVFVPIALFTGMVTQFIFEELTLPASIWSSEE